ncbi:MAG: hypothetical protein BJ554DRAFT_7392 [Olpidium bornovanus]|uniref:Uncharacterized protein n=1 Tax=Olpidium bornovanus TaxID=278681 RepID=A0A8H7ZWJ4_9FUNG|nr:MAG: hypothetical protein BJ554DRAFT_7392 [Olpidium bornovanus]
MVPGELPAVQEDEKKAAAKAALEERIKYPKPQPRPREWDQQLAADLKKQRKLLTAPSLNRSIIAGERRTRIRGPRSWRPSCRTSLPQKCTRGPVDQKRVWRESSRVDSKPVFDLCNVVCRRLKDAQFKEHLDDLRRKQLQSTALWWQVQAQKKREDRSRRVNDMPFDNAFVADDGDRKAPAAEMAKQLLDEQIRVIRVKRENERQEKKRQLLLSKKLLDTTQNE